MIRGHDQDFRSRVLDRITTIRLVNYFEEARSLWQRYVPARGQADTVEGELIRAVEKLRDEAQRHGNLNWGTSHVILGGYIRTQLIGSGIFTGAAASEIEHDINRLLDFERPETSDEPYDRLTDRIVEWSRAHPDPVPREPNPALRI